MCHLMVAGAARLRRGGKHAMKASMLSLTDGLLIVEALAIFALAISGLLEAARKQLDAVGVCMVTGLTAFGGGALRDVLLDRRPFFCVEHATWL